jgi:hypothetical protein
VNFKNSTSVYDALRSVNRWVSRGQPIPDWIQEIRIGYFAQDSRPGYRPDWCDNTMCLIVLAVNLRALKLKIWRESMLIVACTLRAETLRVLSLDLSTSASFLDSILWINKLARLEELAIDAKALEDDFSTAEASQITYLHLPSVRRLHFRGPGNAGFYEFFAKSQYGSLQEIVLDIEDEYGEDPATPESQNLEHLQQFLQVHDLQFLKISLDSPEIRYHDILPHIKVPRLHTQAVNPTIVPDFVALLSPSVEVIIFDVELNENLWPILDNLAAKPTRVKMIQISSTHTDSFVLKPFHWVPGSIKKIDKQQTSIRGRLLLYASLLKKRGIHLCDHDGHTLQQYF